MNLKDNNFSFFIKLFSIILVTMILVFLLTITFINYMVRLNVNKKGKELLNIGYRAIKDINWDLHDNIKAGDENSKIYLDY
ncbi:MAG: hypothetical protein HYU63_08860 [Armatimonadetes bacterium]|nr:hypothetical protein [Armatimonadota bacterium]